MVYEEDQVLFWLTNASNSVEDFIQGRVVPFRALTHDARVFVDKDNCIAALKEIIDQEVFLVVVDLIDENLLETFHNSPRVGHIYLISNTIVANKERLARFMKVRHLPNDDHILLKRLKEDIRNRRKMLPIQINSTDQSSVQSIKNETVDFLWCQLLIDVVCRLAGTSTSKVDLTEECRSNYMDNSKQLNNITEFESSYKAQDAILWYTKDSFLYRLLNKAFRTLNIDLIFRYRFFIGDLFQSLSKLHREQFHKKVGHINVYRGQQMHLTEIEKLRENCGNLISINTFFSTSNFCDVAAKFCGNGEERCLGIESVVFEIELDLSNDRHPFAHIREMSVNKDEGEYLLCMGSIFRIEEVDMYTDEIWYVRLSQSNEVEKELDNLMMHFKQTTGNCPSILELGVLLSNKGDLERAERFYKHLLMELPDDHYDLGVLYNNLGEIYRKQANISEALKYYRKALVELTDTFTFSHEWVAIVYSNIGSAFNSDKNPIEAIRNYRCAYHILLHTKSEEGSLFSTILYGLANAYFLLRNPSEALKLFNRNLSIELKILPSLHPSIAQTYTCLGYLYKIINQFDKALVHLKKALEIYQSTIPKDYYDVATLYVIVGELHIIKNNLPEAEEYFTKVDEVIDRSKLSPDHVVREQIYQMVATIQNKHSSIQIRINGAHKLLETLTSRVVQDDYKIAQWNNLLGNLYYKQDEKVKSLNHHLIALRKIENLPKTMENKKLHMEILNGLNAVGEHKIFTEQTLHLLDELDGSDCTFTAAVHVNLGAHFMKMLQYEKSLEHLFTALKIYEQSKPRIDNVKVAVTNYNIGLNYTCLEKFDEANRYLQISLDTVPTESIDLRAEFLCSLGRLCQKKNDFMEARHHFESSCKLARQFYDENHPVLQFYESFLEKT